MKYSVTLLPFLLLFTSCISDEERRLQTDQTFEGEEIFNLSFTLDEHVFFAFQNFDYYLDTLNHSNMPGCPIISINEDEKEVNLAFGNPECPNNLPERNGKLILNYQDSLLYMDSLIVREGLVRMTYDNYSVNGSSLEGVRLLYPVDSTISGVNFRDQPIDIILKDAEGSSSRISGDYSHEVLFSMDSIIQVHSTGEVSGRNLAGRQFNMEITQTKLLIGECFRSGKVIAAGGRESWTIERTAEPDVNHVVEYQEAPDCGHQANIRLLDGRELVKTQ